MPSAPWFNTRLLAFLDNALVAAIANGLTWIDPTSAETLGSTITGNTPVAEILLDYDRQRIVVVNESYDFVDPGRASNVSVIDRNGALVWRAPLSDAYGYSKIMAFDGAALEVTTWTGRVLLDAEDGHIIDCWFTKGM